MVNIELLCCGPLLVLTLEISQWEEWLKAEASLHLPSESHLELIQTLSRVSNFTELV